MPSEVKAQDTTSLISIKALNDKAEAAKQAADESLEHFWYTTTDTGAGAGAHISQKTQDAFMADPANGGMNTLLNSAGMKIRDGLTALATFDRDGVALYSDGYEIATFRNYLVELGKGNSSAIISFCDGAGELSVTRQVNDSQTVYLRNTKDVFSYNDFASVTIEAGDRNAYKAALNLHTSKDETKAELITSKSSFGLADDSFYITINNSAMLMYINKLEWYADGYSKEQAQFRVSGNGATGDVWLGVGSGGINHGVYSHTNSKWIVYADDSLNVFLNGVNYETQTANKVLASPNGSTGKPTFRALVAGDITSGTFAEARIPTTIARKANFAEGVASGQTVPANGYKDFTVSFGKTFSSVPTVVATIVTTATTINYAHITAVIQARSETGATIRVFNGTNTAYSPAVAWAAMN